MKDIKATRKLKEQLSAHFRSGGTLQNVPSPLNRLPQDTILDCYNYEQARKERKAHPVVGKIALVDSNGVVKAMIPTK